MKFTPVSYNGVSLNDTNFKAYFPVESSMVLQGGADPVEIQRAFLPPDFAVKTIKSKTLPIMIQMLGTAATQIDTLKALFNTRDMTPRLLIVQDQNAVNWQCYATCIDHVKVTGNVTIFNLYISDDTLYSSSTTSVTWNVTAASETKAITPSGNANAKPVITLTPVSGSGGYLKKRFVTITNPTDTTFTNYPIDVLSTNLTSSLINTSSLIPTWMQSLGQDFRIQVDGAEVNRWIGNINTAYTSMWINLSLSPKIVMAYTNTSLTLAGLDTLTFAKTANNANFLKKLTTSSLFLIESEIVECDIPVVGNYTMKITSRGSRNTTAATHGSGLTIKWIEHDIWIKYANTAVTEPSATDSNYDKYKPMFDIATSTNSSWSYTSFNDSSNTSRPGTWIPQVVVSKGGSKTYNVNQNATAGEVISTVMGAKISNINLLSETGDVRWSYTNQIPLTGISGTASVKSTSSVTTYNPLAAIMIWNPTTWSTSFLAGSFSIAVSSSFQTSAFSFTKAGKSVMVYFGGIIPKSKNMNIDYYYEINSTVNPVKLEINTGYIPTIAIGSELTQYSLNALLTNTTNGSQFITVQYPLTAGQSIVIDCDAKTVKFNNRSVLSAFDLSSVRVNWFDLLPGVANIIQFDADFASSITVKFDWQDRLL